MRTFIAWLFRDLLTEMRRQSAAQERIADALEKQNQAVTLGLAAGPPTPK